MDKHELVALLQRNGVDTSLFGTGPAKTLEHLLKELHEEETALIEDSTGLTRLTSVLRIDVLCTVNGKGYRLREDRQEFKDGRVRKRSFLSCSVAEKLKVGEKPNIHAVLRALREELGITYVSSATKVRTSTSEEESPSYPGLQARFTNHDWVVAICPKDFRREGYTEVQSDKTTYFVWDEV